MHSRVWHSNHMKTAKHAFTNLDEMKSNMGRLNDEGAQSVMPASVLKAQGVSFYFKKGDIIEIEENPVFKIEDFTTTNGKIVGLFAIRAWCERWGEFFFSLSLIRKLPLQEPLEGEEKSQLEILQEDNPLGSQLLIRMTDAERARILSGKSIRVKDTLMLNQPTFDKERNEMDYTKLRTSRFYKWEMVE